MPAESISVLGCGWLGLPLAKRLIDLKFTVKGSSTSPEKLSELKDSHIDPYLIECDPQIDGDHVASFFQSNVLILTIPFRRDLKDPEHYRKQIDAIISEVETSPTDFVIFTSSTSVYPQTTKVAKEDLAFQPDTDRAKVLYDVEQALLNNNNFQSTVIRFAGLYGGSRQIGRILFGKDKISRANHPVNLIHLDDCIEIITTIISQDIRQEIFNAVSDEHPLRRDLYAEAARVQGVTEPRFEDDSSAAGKIVSNEKLKKKLNFHFRHPDPMDFST